MEAILKHPVQRTTFESLSLVNFFLMSFHSLWIGLLTIFNTVHYIVLGLLCLLPSECVRVQSDGFLPIVLAQTPDLCKKDLPHLVMLLRVYNMWVMKWKQHAATASADIPKKFVDALQ